MWTEYITALAVIVVCLAGWIAVQAAWRRMFWDPDADPDVLARRGDCGNCGCVGLCQGGAVRGGKQEQTS